MDGKEDFHDIGNSYPTLTLPENTTGITVLTTLPSTGKEEESNIILIISCIASMLLLFTAMGMWAWYQPIKSCLRKPKNQVTYEDAPPQYEIALKMPRPAYFKYNSINYPLKSVITSESGSNQKNGNIQNYRTNIRPCAHFCDLKPDSVESFSGNEPFVLSDFAHRLTAVSSQNNLPTYQEYTSGLKVKNMECNPPTITTYFWYKNKALVNFSYCATESF